MTRKKIILAIILTALYCLLLVLLVTAESAYTPAQGEDTISTFPKALWYSLTTLTTVGYGDLYPHTVVGRIIGSVFLLLSVGFLVFLFSALWSRIRNRILPKMRLRFALDKEWFIFSEYTPEAAALSRNLMKRVKNCLCIFSDAESSASIPEADGVAVSFSIEELIKMKRSNASVFFISSDEYENYQNALMQADAPVYCMTEYEPNRITDQITFFHPCQCSARLYWRRFPILKGDETIALIGGGKYAAAILEQALLLNVFAPDQHLTYLIYGDPADFAENHPYLSEVFSIGGSDPNRDSLFFLPAQWYTDPDQLKDADRIIVCYDSEEKTIETLYRLNRYFPVTGTVYARLSEPFEKVVTFGGIDEIFTPELVLHTHLDQAAKALHEIYCNETNAKTSWQELSAFLRRSNMASADHLEVKAQILLGSNDSGENMQERFARAYQAYAARKDTDAEIFRLIEHRRWMRFHILNNWQYAPQRDNERRLHPLMLPYEMLPVSERRKDDSAWELLGTVAKMKIE